MKRKKVDGPLFDRCKKLIDAGWSAKEIADTLSISDVTVGRIRRSTSIGMYNEMIRMNHPMPSGGVLLFDEPERPINETALMLNKINNTLEQICNALVKLNKEELP